MKKITYILIVVLGLVSCQKDMLTLVPQTSLSSASFYQNAAQYNQALTGAYANLRNIAMVGIYEDEMRSDNTFFTYYAPDRGTEESAERIAEFTDIPITAQKVNSPGYRWGIAYSGIASANTILGRISGSSLAQADKDQISGEALFLRAFYYYELVQHYGGVPLQLKEVVSQDGAFLPRNTVDEVYNQIITDLIASIPFLPVAKDFPLTGRATQGAAKMLLAYSYMSKPTKEYSKAESALLDITKMDYDLFDNYTDAFSLANKNGKESIFEVQYQMGNDGQQSDFIWRFIPKTTNSEAILGLHGTTARGGLQSGGWNVPTQEMVDSYESGDLRLPASIGVAVGTEANGAMTVTAVKSPVNFVRPSSGLTFYYFIKKYLHPPYVVEWNTDDNWPVFRYSGALLLLSECLVAENKSSEALPYLNKVRHRAGLPDLTEATKENVANEMRHELAFENHRWTDLIRNGNAVDVLNAKGVTMKSLYPILLPGTFNVTKEKLLYPIPFNEMQLNHNLVQNPGYN